MKERVRRREIWRVGERRREMKLVSDGEKLWY